MAIDVLQPRSHPGDGEDHHASSRRSSSATTPRCQCGVRQERLNRRDRLWDTVLGDGDLAAHDEDHAGADLAVPSQTLAFAEGERLTEATRSTDFDGSKIGNIWS